MYSVGCNTFFQSWLIFFKFCTLDYRPSNFFFNIEKFSPNFVRLIFDFATFFNVEYFSPNFIRSIFLRTFFNLEKNCLVENRTYKIWRKLFNCEKKLLNRKSSVQNLENTFQFWKNCQSKIKRTRFGENYSTVKKIVESNAIKNLEKIIQLYEKLQNPNIKCIEFGEKFSILN